MVENQSAEKVVDQSCRQKLPESRTTNHDQLPLPPQQHCQSMQGQGVLKRAANRS